MKTSEGSHITCKHWVQLTRHLSVGRKGHISLEWHQGDVGFAIWLCKSSLKLGSTCDQPLRLMKLWRHKAYVILRVFILYSSFHLLTCVPAHPLTKLLQPVMYTNIIVCHFENPRKDSIPLLDSFHGRLEKIILQHSFQIYKIYRAHQVQIYNPRWQQCM